MMSTHMLTEQNHRLAKMLLEQQGELNKARARVAELEGELNGACAYLAKSIVCEGSIAQLIKSDRERLREYWHTHDKELAEMEHDRRTTELQAQLNAVTSDLGKMTLAYEMSEAVRATEPRADGDKQ